MFKCIKYLISDFDGVMTDNQVYIDDVGREMVMVSRADGQGINMLRELGISVMILSTEENPVVSKRAQKLKVECLQDIKDKAKALRQWALEKNVDLKNAAYIGNDINDMEALKLCGIKIVPQDAYDEVKEIADFVTDAKGGHGVIRELAGLIKNNRGLSYGI